MSMGVRKRKKRDRVGEKKCNIASNFYPLGILNKPKTPCACDRAKTNGKIENDENL